MTSRIYVGNLPLGIRESELDDLFYKYGKIRDIDLKTPSRLPAFAFISYDDYRDAQDAIRGRDGYHFYGYKLRVEFSRSDRGGREGPAEPRRAGGRRSEWSVVVTNLPHGCNWQVLKDFMRKVGDVVFADVDRNGEGIVDFSNRADMEDAIRKLDDTLFKSFTDSSYIRVRSANKRRDRSEDPRRESRRRSRSPAPRGGRSDSRSRSRDRSGNRRGRDSKDTSGDSYKVVIPRLSSSELEATLDEYLKRGAELQKTEEMRAISADIQGVMQTAPVVFDPKLFYFVEASSGRGKSQMAQSFGFPVIYLPLNTAQGIYKCFTIISFLLSEELHEDLHLLSKKTHNNIKGKLASGELYAVQDEFRTVGLLVELFKLVRGKTNEESIRLLSGRDSGSTFTYSKMTLQAAREAIALLSTESASGSGVGAEQQQTKECSIPLFMVDEVPPLLSGVPEENDPYLKCILLRNLIRCMHCVCLLSGTEAAAMNTIDNLHVNSRGLESREYMRLISRLPPTNWNIFASDLKYMSVIAALDVDVRDMLKRTRPLFAQHVLDAMLQQASDGRLTTAVLKLAKRNILRQNSRFSTIKGLYAQSMLMHSEFIARAVDEFTEEKSSPRSEPKLSREEREEIMAEMQSCVRYHYGEMRPANIGINLELPLPLFVRPVNTFLSVRIELSANNLGGRMLGDYTFRRFLPNVVFVKPCDDELLYLICLRDGLVSEEREVSSSYALRTLHVKKENSGFRAASNARASTSSGKFLENEVLMASVVASHSFGGLSGCPLSFFLRSLVAQLNPGESYVPESAFTLEVPPHYEKISVGLMSAVNTSWQREQREAEEEEEEEEGSRWVQDKSILLTDLNWSANMEENDGSFPVTVGGTVVRASLEMKCYEKSTPTAEFTKTIEKNRKNKHLITIMVVNTATITKGNNQTFNTAMQDHNVIRISGNASGTQNVGTALSWKALNKHNAEARFGTVVQVELDSIYWGRYDRMKFIYHTT